MRLLILGGTQFLGRAIATDACTAGHAVTCAARGVSGAVPAGARLVKVDRDAADGLTPLAGETFDGSSTYRVIPDRCAARLPPSRTAQHIGRLSRH